MAEYNPSAIAELAVAQLGAKPRRAQAIAEAYQTVVYKEILYGYYILANSKQIRANQIPFSLNRVRRALGRYGTSPQRYWWDWLHHASPIVEIVKTGNSKQGVLSMVTPTIPIDIILDSGNGKDLVAALYSAQDLDSELHFAPINTHSLENYILATTALNSPDDTIKNNLQQARLIFSVAKECRNQLPQVVSASQFGRTYYKGLNLQNTHRTVRHAALGACYSVDIDASVFNWKYSVVPFNQELTYTRELIQDKKRVRQRLAKLVFDNASERSIKTIKTVITAMSFGARLGKTGYYLNPTWTKTNGEPKFITSSIDKIIYSKELRQRLFDDPWMKQFVLEQDRINKWLADELVKTVNEGLIEEEALEHLRSERGRISHGKLIAYAYQQTEQQIMKKIVEWSRSEVLLQVHDGVYFKTKPDMPSMQTMLQDVWPLATLSMEEITNYRYLNRVEDLEHKELIRQETIRANGGVDPVTTGIHTREMSDTAGPSPHHEPDWEAQMLEEFNQHFAVDPNMPDFAKQRLLY